MAEMKRTTLLKGGGSNVDRHDKPAAEVKPKPVNTAAVDNMKLIVARNVLLGRVKTLCVRITKYVDEHPDSIESFEKLVDKLTT
ncbi:MAG: hypothetical protein IIB77_06560 [Proteobacteria bacterium]|nr:hypothetical protein [Pseudomonadota bacterium]